MIIASNTRPDEGERRGLWRFFAQQQADTRDEILPIFIRQFHNVVVVAEVAETGEPGLGAAHRCGVDPWLSVTLNEPPLRSRCPVEDNFPDRELKRGGVHRIAQRRCRSASLKSWPSLV